jgi:hypothetical protein
MTDFHREMLKQIAEEPSCPAEPNCLTELPNSQNEFVLPNQIAALSFLH